MSLWNVPPCHKSCYANDIKISKFKVLSLSLSLSPATRPFCLSLYSLPLSLSLSLFTLSLSTWLQKTSPLHCWQKTLLPCWETTLPFSQNTQYTHIYNWVGRTHNIHTYITGLAEHTIYTRNYINGLAEHTIYTHNYINGLAEHPTSLAEGSRVTGSTAADGCTGSVDACAAILTRDGAAGAVGLGSAPHGWNVTVGWASDSGMGVRQWGGR